MQIVNVLIKPSSSQCNMHCDYCFYCDEASKRNTKSYGFMSYETIENIISKTLAFAEKEVYIAFQGGEPTLRGLDFYKKVVELENQNNTKNIIIHNSLQTNGFSINEEWCDFFVENNFLVGLSIDGLSKTHNYNRHSITGSDSYPNVFHTAYLFEKKNVSFNILTVVNKQTAKDIKQIYHAYKKRGWNYQQYIACLNPFFENTPQKYTLNPEAYGKFLIDLFHLWYADLRKNQQPYIRQFENWIGILLGYPPEACEHRGSCGLQYVIEADGSVYPCDFYMLDDYFLGNLNTDSYEILDQKRKDIQFVEKSITKNNDCTSCKYYPLCRNGCKRYRDSNDKNIFCNSYKMFFDSCLKDLQDIANVIKDTQRKRGNL